MRNVFLFFLITFLTGSPIIALVVIIAIYLFLDYQFVGLSRGLFRRYSVASEIRALKRDLIVNPHDAAARSGLGRLLVESGRYKEAVGELERAMERMAESEETTCYLGLAYLGIGRFEEGEALLRKALEQNPKFRYGEPYLRWGRFLVARGEWDRAIEILETFGTIHTSSVEGGYWLGLAQERRGDLNRAGAAYRRALDAYRRSPRYKRRAERIWWLKTRIRLANPGFRTGKRA